MWNMSFRIKETEFIHLLNISSYWTFSAEHGVPAQNETGFLYQRPTRLLGQIYRTIYVWMFAINFSLKIDTGIHPVAKTARFIDKR